MNDNETLGQQVARLRKEEGELWNSALKISDRTPWVREAHKVCYRVSKDPGDVKLTEAMCLAHVTGSWLRACYNDICAEEKELPRRDRISWSREHDRALGHPPEEQQEAAANAHQLKSAGVRDFCKQVADKYDVVPETVRRWMKKFPPDE